MDICVIGLGHVGLPTARYLLEFGYAIQGFDIDPIKVEKAKDTGIKATESWEAISVPDVYIICVSTSFIDGKPDLNSVYEICNKIASKVRKNTLVSIESTILPGTCSDIFKNIFKKKVDLVHVPHRYWVGDEKNHGVKQTRLIGGINKRSLEAGLRFYRDVNIPLYIASSIEVSEICKIAENSYRYIQIAFAEELRMICQEFGLSFNEIREACNTKWNVDLLEAREGIGGHCLPKDIMYLSYLTNENYLLRSAVSLDKRYRKWLKKMK